MKTLTFANRNTKEIIRDPLTLCFGLGFPLILILLLSAIQANVPVPLFEIQHLTPGITVCGLSFMTLFSATLIAKDRGSSLLQRLYTTPLTPMDFILGYTMPIIPFAVAQIEYIGSGDRIGEGFSGFHFTCQNGIIFFDENVISGVFEGRKFVS